MELPDYLPGNPPFYGIKQELTPNYQGDTICIPISLNVDPANYTLTAYLKTTLGDNNTVWCGNKDNGIEISQDSVTVNIKAAVAKTFPVGTYYLAVVGDALNGNKLVLFQTMLSIAASASTSSVPMSVVPSLGKLPGAPTNWTYASITYYN